MVWVPQWESGSIECTQQSTVLNVFLLVRFCNWHHVPDVMGGNDDDRVPIVQVTLLGVLYLFVHISRSMLSVLLALLTWFLELLHRFDVVCQWFDQVHQQKTTLLAVPCNFCALRVPC